jgi:hypothetical protein
VAHLAGRHNATVMSVLLPVLGALFIGQGFGAL